MVAISINEIQRDLQAYLRRVQAGEAFLITDHDQPIAEIKPAALVADGERRVDLAAFLKGRVCDARVPLRWREEGVADPTEHCRQTCLELAERLVVKHGLLPSKVVASRQEGIYLEYKSPTSSRILGIEVDNELDIVAVVSEASQTLASGAFEDEEAERLLRIFFDGLAAAAADPRATNS